MAGIAEQISMPSRNLGPMSGRKLQPWMRREQAFIWTAVAAVLSMVVAGVAYLALS
jgi:hypothetical protein